MLKSKSAVKTKQKNNQLILVAIILGLICVSLTAAVLIVLKNERALFQKIASLNYINEQKDIALAIKSNEVREPDPAIFLYDLSEMKGFFTHANRIDWGDIPVTCEAFVVTEARPDLMKGYLNLANGGNGMVSKDDQGRPIINIALSDINNQNDLQKVKRSSANKPVELLIAIKYELGHGAPVCTKAAQILQVK